MTSEIVLLPIKGSPHDPKTIEMACDLVKATGGRLVLLYVFEIAREYPLDIEDRLATSFAEDILTTAEHIARKRKCDVDAQLIQAREAGPAIVLDLHAVFHLQVYRPRLYCCLLRLRTTSISFRDHCR
jgi:hypothetical protein